MQGIDDPHIRGALGSRLHQSEDGYWVAYAQWPSRAVWQRSRDQEPIDPEAAEVMQEAITEALEPILLTPLSDFLIHD